MTDAKDIIKEDKEQQERVVKGLVTHFKQQGEKVFESEGKVHVGASPEEEAEVKAKAAIKEVYPKIIKVLKKYCDLNEKYYSIIAIWIIGTYFHHDFISYPYLFFNAMKGSGKSRLLNLISCLSMNGKMLVSMSEAVLFRTAKGRTICIDEFENIANKEKATLRELLNVAYKKGMVVERAKKVKHIDGEDYAIETFELYCPICMANISGMESVLTDRCISLTLEKSSNKKITRLMEVFEYDKNILEIKRTFSELFGIRCSLCSVVSPDNIYIDWNQYIYNYTNYTNNTKDTNYTNNTNKGLETPNPLFEKILKTDLDSRYLELFFPLFIIADLCSHETFEEIVRISEEIVKAKKQEDVVESRDVALIDFISKRESTIDYVPMKLLTNNFMEYMEEDEHETEWLNTKWVGRALKRLGLIIDKRRVSKGVEITVDYGKARNKIKMFKGNKDDPTPK